ncbi:hypothetical protein [Moritella sp. Urea-trap-13]|uniref:hypothetical protein n=1 Tax=Moritella sp. Urea-trap-13 TaxID=2058327 RepID=UPI000C31D3F7|nr:hypothetical protein [Moritella sp. Urea-trap-13]PKH04777.1 hypothetical protein CXF93_21425 [Moritella sp. Urea-trap-13]
MNNVLDKIDEMLTCATLQGATRSQLENHHEMYKRSMQYLAGNEHKIAFIGNVGAGKTTSVCHLLGLVDKEVPVLSTGSGRTTLCEVHIKKAPEDKIEVLPYTDEEVRDYLYDFSLYLKSNDEDGEQEGFKLSAEIERALRNMLDLKVIRTKVNGKRSAIDHAKIYAEQFTNANELCNEFIQRVNLTSRTQTEFINLDGQEKMTWLRETFKLINSATHKNVGLAKKITLFIPELNVNDETFSITFIDTKGVDQTVNRVDLDQCLTNDKTVSVFCSRFNDAPDQTCSKMVDSAIQAGLKPRLNEESILLVLDRAGEAEDVMDYDEAVGNKEDGRDIKADQVSGELSQKYAVRNFGIEFFDAKQDKPEELLGLLVNKVRTLRIKHEQHLIDINQSVYQIESEIKSQSTSLAMNQVKLTLESWLKKSQACSPTLSEFFIPLIDRISSKGTYAASVRASVNRNGDWHNLDYYQELAVAARRQCVSKIHPLRDELTILIDNMLSQEELKPAYSLLKQLKNTTEIRLDEISQLALAKGRSVYESKVKADSTLWNNMYKEWGQGSGYKGRIAEHSHHWFKVNDYSRFEFDITRVLVEHWERYILEIEKLIGSGLK